MKIIVSHDVDHLFRRDHYKDIYMLKMFIRTNLELVKRRISFKEYFERFSYFYKPNLNNIDSVIEFNQSLGFKSTFFIGTSQGLSLNYKENDFKGFVPLILNKGFEVGIHGIDFQSIERMKAECEIMKKYLDRDFGIRMHYLRMDEDTKRKMSDIGYQFDCSEYSNKDPYKVGEMWEFPIQIMDTYMFYIDGMLSRPVDEALRLSIEQIETAKVSSKKYFSILFHDAYYSSNFSRVKKWYEDLMHYLVDNNYEIVTYKQAIEELENEK